MPAAAQGAVCRRALGGVVLLVAALLLGGCASYDTSGQAPYPPTNVPNVGNPAGVKFYAETDEGVFVLLGDHVFPIRRGWADFGGAADSGETIEQTAAREAEEETRGYFKREDILEAISGQTPVFSRGGYAFYFMKVDKVPAEDIAKHPIPFFSVAYRERGPYAWVPYSDIERYLDAEPPTGPRAYSISPEYLPGGWFRTDWYWPALISHFRIAKEAGAIPWEQSGK